MIADELRTVWTEQRNAPNRSGYDGRRLSPETLDLFAGVDPGGNRRFVALRLSKEQQRSIRDRYPRSSRGILTESVPGEDTVTIFLREQPGIPESVFPAVVADVLDVALAGAPPKSLRDAFDRFSNWQRALQRRAGPMSSAEVRGLIGELLVLRDILFPTLGISRALDAWKSTGDEDLHDFGGRGWELEAKAMVAFSSTFHVSAIGQLESTSGGEVFLSVAELEQSEDGLSLKELIGTLKAAVETDPILTTELVNALIKRGANEPSLDAEAHVRYRTAAFRVFRVGATFPIFRRSETPKGIRRAEYDVDVIACVPHEIEATEFNQILKVMEGES